MKETDRKLAQLREALFPTRERWDLEDLKAQGLPLYWNEGWLREQLEQHGSLLAVARRWGYPPREVRRVAEHFGIAPEESRAWVSKFFQLDGELLKEVDRLRGRQSRNRWIAEALEAYLSRETPGKQAN